MSKAIHYGGGGIGARLLYSHLSPNLCFDYSCASMNLAFAHSLSLFWSKSGNLITSYKMFERYDFNSDRGISPTRTYNFIKKADKTYRLRLLLPRALVYSFVCLAPLIRFGKLLLKSTIPPFHILTMEVSCNSQESLSLVFFIRCLLM